MVRTYQENVGLIGRRDSLPMRIERLLSQTVKQPAPEALFPESDAILCASSHV